MSTGVRKAGITWKMVSTEAKLLLIGIPVFLWTIIPIYHMVLFSISPRNARKSSRPSAAAQAAP